MNHLPGLAPEPALTPRQSLALEIIREQGPLDSYELGRRVHVAQGHHSDRLCQWCPSTGVSLGRKLRSVGLAREVVLEGRRRWVSAEWSRPVEGYDPASAEVPF